MTRSATIAAVYLLDWLAGDPEWLPHPVRWIGRATQAGEGVLLRKRGTPSRDFLAGAALTLSIVGSAYGLAAASITRARRWSRIAGWSVELLLGWTCLASRNLKDESTAVIRAAESGDLPLARKRLARIVGRDTANLDETEISRAVIETLAESACDGIVSPLFYLAVGGVPAAMAYKAINTLDSMIGHADERYFYFGKFAARLDDAANYLPSRGTALAIAASTAVDTQASLDSALRTWQRDGSKHKSPNAGQPESAMAGALKVRLGGANTYAGEPLASPLLGAEFRPPRIQDAKRALRLTVTASVLSALAAIALNAWRKN